MPSNPESSAAVNPLELSELRLRTSAKWREYPDDVLPLFVAESDFPLAPAIVESLTRALHNGDTGYASSKNPLAKTFSEFAQRRFGWSVNPDWVRTTADVSMAMVEILRALLRPGDPVVITPPVYPPFFRIPLEAGGSITEVPLLQSASGWELDLAGLERAFASGARAMMLCNPHNPTGTVHSAQSLRTLAKLADRFNVTVISDEIHAPLAQPGSGFVPYASVSTEAAATALTVTSASKAFNLAGLKCALMVADSTEQAQVLHSLPAEIGWRTSQFGLLASVAAFESDSDKYLDGVLVTLDQNRQLLARLLAQHLPKVSYLIPDAGYLAWLDMTSLGWDEDPSRQILREAKVALNSGPTFGEAGQGYVRMNFATSPAIITEAVHRIAAVLK